MARAARRNRIKRRVRALMAQRLTCLEPGARLVVRALAGATNPTQAVPGSIRGDLAREWGHGNIENLIHASDSPENAEKEIALWLGRA